MTEDEADTDFGVCSSAYNLADVPGESNVTVPRIDNGGWDAVNETGENASPSSEESDIEHRKIHDFKHELAEWALSGNIAQNSVTKLLGILRKHNMDVPAQATTLLRTPRNVNVQRKSGGDYIYIGLEKGIRNSLSSVPADTMQVIELSFNIDGLPVYKSKNTSLWPIQCNVVNFPDMRPFVVALYYATHKPQDLEFLQEFVEELKSLMDKGIHISDGATIPVIVRCFVCDAPARALVKGTVQYNGKYGCDFCEVCGQFDGRMMFLYVGNKRTDKRFREEVNPEHHKVSSPLLQLEIDMILQFPIDPMHAIDLGVTKKLLLMWTEGPLGTRLSAGQKNIISTYLSSIRPFMPPLFNRKPRGLQEVKLWKATEFRTFLMYTGPVVLKYVLPNALYKHFMCFSIAVCILYNEKLVSKHSGYARELLLAFIEKSKEIYGEKFLTYNVHSLCHMADIAQRYRCLENCTAYAFENNMAKMKRWVRGTGKPIVQIAHRLVELEEAGCVTSPSCKEVYPKRNYCYRMKAAKFCRVHEVYTGSKKILCEVYTKTQSFYTTPCDSRIIGIHEVKTDTEMQLCNFQDLHSLSIYVPMSLFERDQPFRAVVIPLMHTSF